MGKRKERRLAAKSAANRRLKLDLFADPPDEEEMDKSHNQEVGGNQEQDHSTSVPNSPSSSGQNQENPLLLLEQYSDDEVDDASKQQRGADVMGDFMESEGKEKEHVGACENLESDKDEVIEGNTSRPLSDRVSSPKELKAGEVEAIENGSVDADLCEIELKSHACVSELSEHHGNGHIIGHWKLVLHEESNQYYYWNTVTGETSWVVPEALALDTQSADEHRISAVAKEEENASAVEALTFTDAKTGLNIYGSVLDADGCEGGNFISREAEGFARIELKSEKVDVSSESVVQYCADNVTTSYGNFSVYPSLSQHLNNPHGVQCAFSEEKDVHQSSESDHYASEDTHASQLVKYGEVLLQRLGTLYRSVRQPEGYEGIKKEIDIRISDCRALWSYGSALLPFWWHTDLQFKQIESAISKTEASLLGQPEEVSDLTTKQKDSQGGAYSEVTVKDDEVIIISESGSDVAKNENLSTERMLLKSDFEAQGSEHKKDTAPKENTISNSSTSMAMLINNAEEDMDVEMEVDDVTTPPSPPSEQFFQTNMSSARYPSLTSNESNIPPPPEEEWIPPPPPEVEPLPPPPPSEGELNPPEDASTSFPSSYTDTISYPLPGHYNVGYHIPAYDYYSATGIEVSNGSYYGIAGGGQLNDSESPAYYEPLVSSNLADVALSGTQVPATFFDAVNASISSGPVFSDSEPSVFYVESSAVSYKDLVPATASSSVLELPENSLGNNVPMISADYQTSTLSSLSTERASGASSGNGCRLLDAQPPAVSNNQSKARSKKRVVVTTLRSNKKVSSLVDKWKAAKEELHGDEDEPDNPLEILEKKRQKEIEVWRAQQVATGEAQDNANFVPLGGDWRERVKRKRTNERSTEDAQTSSAAAFPDLVELSKNLPSGWQVYWDDSTKQAYYGNHSTSEITWIRPTS